MTLEDVKEDILARAKLEADNEIAKANREKEKKLKKTQKEIEEEKKELKKKHDDELESIRLNAEREVTSFERKLEKNQKQEIVLSFKKKLYEQISRLEKKQKRKHIASLKKFGKKNFGEGSVYVSEKDTEKGENAMDILGGVVIENKTSKTRVDMSYDKIIIDILDENTSEIQKLLFEK